MKKVYNHSQKLEGNGPRDALFSTANIFLCEFTAKLESSSNR